MAINIPIISSLNTKGFDSAKKEFQSLQGFGAKSGFLLQKAMLPAAAALGGLTAFGFKAAQSASDLNEEISKSKQIFGTSSAAIEQFANNAAKTLGQSKTEALQAAASFGIMGKAAGLSGVELTKFSTDLTVLTSDLASFNNADPAEVAKALGAALRGEAEPMRRFGVLLNDATLKAEAMAMGIYKGNGVLGQQEKILAANQIIFKQTSVAQDDFARTSGGVANQQRILKASIKDLTADIGQKFVPVLQTVLTYANKLIIAYGEKGLIGVLDAVSKKFMETRNAADGSVTTNGKLYNAAVKVRNGFTYMFNAARQLSNDLLVTEFRITELKNAVGTDFKKQLDNSVNSMLEMQKALKLVAYMGPVASRNLSEFRKYALDMAPVLAQERLDKLAEAEKKAGEAAAAAGIANDKAKDKAAAHTAKLKRQAEAAKEAAKALAEDYARALENAVQLVKDQFSPALMRANDQLTKATDTYNNFYNATREVVRGIFNVGNAFTTAKDNQETFNKALAERTTAYAKLNKLTAGTEEYAAALEEVAQAEEKVNEAAKPKRTFFEVLDEQAAKAAELSTGIEKLIEAGLDDPALLQQILGAGADVGLEIINGLLAGGKASIDRLVGISSTINAAADRIAKLTADKWYKSGVDQAQQIVNGVNSVIENTEFLLKFAIDPESVAAIGAQFGTNIGTVQRGGVPTLTSNPFGGVLGSINTSTNRDMSAFGGGNVSTSSVTINVNGGDPNAVVSALRTYMRQNGSVPIKVSNAY